MIQCLDLNCNWQLRASKTMEESDFFVIQKYVGIHSCSLLSRNASHSQATYAVVGEQVAPQFIGGQKGPEPKAIQSFACIHLKVRISYYKAWRGRKYAQSLIRGSTEESFYMFPSYRYMLEKVNPGIVTCIEVNEDSR